MIQPVVSASQQRWYSRLARGVITQYSLYINDCLFTVELFHGKAQKCCSIRNCQHGKIAEQLEQQYQEEHRDPDLAYCSSCGRMARRRPFGVVLCPNCAS